MCNLYLKFPTFEDEKCVWELRQEFLEAGEFRIPGSGTLEQFDSYERWLDKIEREVNPSTCGEGRVPCTQYLTYRKSDNRLVGLIQIRHGLNDYLLQYGGHIGDCIRPSERGKGYATEQISLALKECQKMKINSILITCKKSNVASARTIIKNNGKLDNEVDDNGTIMQRYWINLSK